MSLFHRKPKHSTVSASVEGEPDNRTKDLVERLAAEIDRLTEITSDLQSAVSVFNTQEQTDDQQQGRDSAQLP